MSTTGPRPTRSAERAGPAGFTLIELILVMAVLVIVLALVAPSLSNFFRGRSLDSEARRFVSLTRYAESRAVSEGVPMLVWIDPEQRSYGLTEEVSYTTGGDTKAVTYELARDVVLELLAPTSAAARREQAQASTRFGRNSAVIRFQPDGLVTEGGPDALAFKPDPSTGRKVEATDAVWVARSFNGLHYEIPTNQLVYVRR